MSAHGKSIKSFLAIFSRQLLDFLTYLTFHNNTKSTHKNKFNTSSFVMN